MSDPIDVRITSNGVVNWAKTYRASPQQFFEPTNVEEVQAIVRDATAAGRNVRVVGSAHSPNACAMSDDVMISLRRMNNVLSLDDESRIVRAQAGCRLEDLHPWLDERGLAFANLGSISEQTLAGMISTGTHGTGRGAGCLATCVTALELVVADGRLLTCSKDTRPELFRAALCSLGVLGVIVTVSFRAVPAFDLHGIDSPCRLEDVLTSLPGRISGSPYYRFWWFPHTNQCVEWRAKPVEPRLHRAALAPSLLGRLLSWVRGDLVGFHGLQASLALALVWPAWLSPSILTPWRWPGLALRSIFGVARKAVRLLTGSSSSSAAEPPAPAQPGLVPAINRTWYDIVFGRPKERVDRSDRVFNFNCLFKQHVDEWAVPVDALPQAMTQLRQLIDSGKLGHGVHYPIEIRFVAGDDIWLSPCYGRPTAWIGIIAYKPYGWESPYRSYFLAFEQLMASLGGRPHWAKDFHWTGSNPRHFPQAYPRWGDFHALRAAVDPAGTFLNPWAKRVLGLDGGQPAIGSGLTPRKADGLGAGAQSPWGGQATGAQAEVVAPPVLPGPSTRALYARLLAGESLGMSTEAGSVAPAEEASFSSAAASAADHAQPQPVSPLASALGCVPCGIGYEAAGTTVRDSSDGALAAG